MRVTKAQAEANRAHIVETASSMFREHGYDGIGVADLMAAAGFTHGGFYKHFGSKADLMTEAAACGMTKMVAQAASMDPVQFVEIYVSRRHRDAPGKGCTMAALGADASRQSDDLKQTFEKGTESMLAALAAASAEADDGDAQHVRARTISLFAQAIGALVLSRACPDDSALADEVLDVCRTQMLAQLATSPPATESD